MLQKIFFVPVWKGKNYLNAKGVDFKKEETYTKYRGCHPDPECNEGEGSQKQKEILRLTPQNDVTVMKYTALTIFIQRLFKTLQSGLTHLHQAMWIIGAGFILALVMGGFPLSAYAQNKSSGTAFSISIADKNAKDGSIIISTAKGFALSSIAYDTNMYGVLTESPAVYLQNTADSTLKPVTSSGKAYVSVSSINGNIKKNDLITTSTIAGVGQKSTRNGMVLGTALEDYSNSNQKITAKILVALNPHFNASFSDTKTNVLEVLRNASDPTTLTQATSLRYVVAAGIVLSAFGIGFIFFGRVTSSGVEALGRNPLASRTIQFSLIFNLVLMIVIILVGLGISYMILIL